MYKEVFSSRLKEARKRTGLTQKEVAELLKIQQSAIAKYENDLLEPNIETLGKLAECYGVSTDWLLGLKMQGIQPNYEKELNMVAYSQPNYTNA